MEGRDVLEMGKRLVDKADLDSLQSAWSTLDFQQIAVDPSWLFQKLYLHACLRGCQAIAVWLQMSVFPTLDPLHQLAIRQCFPYGRHLLRQHARA